MTGLLLVTFQDSQTRDTIHARTIYMSSKVIILEKCKKVVYLGHRRFHRTTHPVRKKGKHYNGEADHRKKPAHRNGADIFGMVKDLEVIFGKGPSG